MKPFTTIAIILFAPMALAHLYRPGHELRGSCGRDYRATVVSAIGMIAADGLALMLVREAQG